jgi:hypothetical protein
LQKQRSDFEIEKVKARLSISLQSRKVVCVHHPHFLVKKTFFNITPAVTPRQTLPCRFLCLSLITNFGHRCFQAGLGFRYSLDGALHHDDHGCVARLEAREFGKVIPVAGLLMVPCAT